MTDDLEQAQEIANRLHSRAAVHTEAGHHTDWGRSLLDAEACIISLIQRVREAEDGSAFLALSGIREAIGDEGRTMLSDLPGAVIAEIERARAAGRAEALEEAAKVAGGFGPSRPLIAGRTPTERIIGRWEGEQAASGSIATAIRALVEKAG